MRSTAGNSLRNKPESAGKRARKQIHPLVEDAPALQKRLEPGVRSRDLKREAGISRQKIFATVYFPRRRIIPQAAQSDGQTLWPLNPDRFEEAPSVNQIIIEGPHRGPDRP
ncbi:MAG: hypothetical protein JF606_27385 [Burkholderiales bacterium]|nr:hypothetical protein [Burkholderiales bacterium]